MTDKAKRLIEGIESINGVCAEGKRGIRKLVEIITGEKLTPEPARKTYSIGQRIRLENGRTYLICLAYTQTSGVSAVQAADLITGHVLATAVHVRDIYFISDTEMGEILTGRGFSIIVPS
jgi:hypothetical protein